MPKSSHLVPGGNTNVVELSSKFRDTISKFEAQFNLLADAYFKESWATTPNDIAQLHMNSCYILNSLTRINMRMLEMSEDICKKFGSN